jgi:shikimate dehydrogenase
MEIYGLVGYPLGHSFSKRHFEEKFRNENINASFENYEIDSIDKFIPILENDSKIKGLSVTIPYKQSIIPLLDEMSEEARIIGAVNSISITQTKDGFISKGHNTDVYGFKNSLLNFIGNTRSKALVLGSGGAAKAVKYALEELNIKFLEVSRKPTNKQISYEDITDIIKDYKIIINTSPLGMFPKVDSFPDIPYELLDHTYYLFDLTYNPEITAFMRKGMDKNAKVKNGLEMLHLQAEKSWSLWHQASNIE